MSPQKWSGRVVTRARAYWAVRLPLPCRRCGKPVTKDQRWQVGHIVDRADRGAVADIANQWPEHGKCNESAGGRRGAAITNARRDAVVLASSRARGIRGV